MPLSLELPEPFFMNSSDTHLTTTAIPVPDRRHYSRFTVNVQIEIHQDGSDVPTRIETTDLSRGGCYIQLEVPLSVGIRLQAPDTPEASVGHSPPTTV